MENRIEVYSFENNFGEPMTDWTTQDVAEAREYGQEHGYAVICNTYRLAENELAWDFTPDEDEDDEGPVCVVEQEDPEFYRIPRPPQQVAGATNAPLVCEQNGYQIFANDDEVHKAWVAHKGGERVEVDVSGYAWKDFDGFCRAAVRAYKGRTRGFFSRMVQGRRL